jgi:SWI/SNF-related matrix-associated actin-dependent regulator of chromatin subfamily A member 5
MFRGCVFLLFTDFVGHILKNDQTQMAHAVRLLNAEYRLLLTGTPLQKYLPQTLSSLHNCEYADNSSLHELWALFHFLYPDIFTAQTSDAFKQAFDLTKGTYNTTFIDSASALLSKMMLRRMKVDMVEIKLPPKEELLVYVPLTPLQR